METGRWFCSRFVKTFIGAKKADATDQEKAENKYRPIKVFMESFFVKLTPDTAEFLLNFYEKHNILDDITKESLEKLISVYKKD